MRAPKKSVTVLLPIMIIGWKLIQAADAFSTIHLGAVARRIPTRLYALPPPNKSFCKMINTLGLDRSLVPTSDLGYYGWKPEGTYRSVGNATAEEIRGQVDLGSFPDPLVDFQELNEKLPWTFQDIETVIRLNKYPYGQDYVAALYVAKTDRQLDLNSVEFLFGSYTLFFLGMERIQRGEKCLIARVPGTTIIMVTRYKVYKDNLATKGYQFERLVTGWDPFTPNPMSIDVQHLHLMKIAKARILFAGQVDSLDDRGEPTEIKHCANPNPIVVTKRIFQAIGSGCIRIAQGEIHGWAPEPTLLDRVTIKTIEKTRKKKKSLGWAGARICKNVAWLHKECKSSLKDGDVKELYFLPKREGERNAPMAMRDSDVKMEDIFPRASVIEELLEDKTHVA